MVWDQAIRPSFNAPLSCRSLARKLALNCFAVGLLQRDRALGLSWTRGSLLGTVAGRRGGSSGLVQSYRLVSPTGPDNRAMLSVGHRESDDDDHWPVR
ncbi:hypothetical protein PSCLAVI8L_90128 [Pseudoclavibacter sp. 8L]|nr:hypothetical protein PSCLAVI8L_90128 [Pseudoclavibacter sp. 8L]